MADMRDEQIGELRRKGYSEEEAIRRVKGGESVRKSTDDTPEPDGPSEDRQFVLVTKDFSGLGWAKKLQEEGEHVTLVTDYSQEDEPEHLKEMKQVGKGWFDVMDLQQAMRRLKSDQTYWIFAENHFPDEAEQLRKSGQRVFGGDTLSEKMEHDRDYAVEIAEEYGLDSPATHEFQSREEGLAFLDSNPDKAYVFKPDDGKFSYMTFVPIRAKDPDANRELHTYMEHMREEPGQYILQERIAIEDGLEVNAELWLYQGEPLVATVGLECKRKNTYDLGEMCGCSGDIMQFISPDTKLVQQTIGKLLPFYKKEGYTGFADVNVIFTKDGKPHFLEVCNRFGYNSHITMLLGLGLDSFGSVIADYTDGYVDDFADRFRTDIGTSLTIFLDHPRPGLPVHVDPAKAEMFYPFDGCKEDDQLLLTGYSDEIGVVVGHGPTPESAAKKLAMSVAMDEMVSLPDMYYRWDLWETNFYNAPVLRYRELKKRGLL